MDMNRPVWIYCLVDPRTELPMYVGQTVNTTARFTQHLKSPAARVSRWVNDLMVSDMLPTMDILECCCKSNAHQREQYWLQIKLAENENLLNSMGNPHISNQKLGDPNRPHKRKPKTFTQIVRSLMSVDEAATKTSMTRHHVYKLIRGGAFPVVRIGSAIRVPRNEFDAWIESRKTTGDSN